MTTNNVPTLLIAIPEQVQTALRDTLFWRADIRRSFAAPAELFNVARTLSPDIIVAVDDGDVPRLNELLENLRRDPATHECIVILLGTAAHPPGALEGHSNCIVLPTDFSEAGEKGPWHARLEELLKLRQRRETRVGAEFPVRAVVTLPDNSVRRIEATAVNISSRGMLLETPETLPRPSRAELTFQLPGAAAALAVVGEIVRTAQTADGHKLAGIHFTVVRKDARVGIRDFLRTQRPTDPSSEDDE